MSLININEIKKKIEYHEAQLSILRQLMEISGLIEGKKPAAPKAAKAKKAKKRGGRRKKRGAVSNAVIALLEHSKRPLTAGEIKKSMEDQNLAQKGSSSVYSTLLQMSKRGAIKKVKTDKGNSYTLGGAKPKGKAKKAKK